MIGCIAPQIMDDITMRKKKGIVIWPAYIDSTLTRGQGRRIPRNLAAPNVTVSMLAKAAESASLEYTIDQTKLYPRTWMSGNRGYIVVSETSHPKKRLLLMLAKGTRKLVAQRESASKDSKKKKGKKRRR